jgi:glycogen debranching enzyme
VGRVARLWAKLAPYFNEPRKPQARYDSPAQGGANARSAARLAPGRSGVGLPAAPGLAAPPELRFRDDAWWKEPAATRIGMSIPIYALRRDQDDPGIGKFSDLGRYYREVWAGQGVDVIHLLPHFAVLEESPYAPVSSYALNEDNLDWALVPEVAGEPALRERLKAREPAQQQAVDYAALRARETQVAQQAYRIFQREQLGPGTERARQYQEFLARNGQWLYDYAEFMAFSQLLQKPALDWKPQELGAARQDSRFSLLKEARLYAQWNAAQQFQAALDVIHQAGGKVIFDIPMFRSKNSVDAWKHPQYFTDIRTRNPGVKNPWVNEDWKDLALWNWTQLRSEGYRPLLAPFAHWLGLGLDGARVDALHFAYNFGNGQLASGDEPGDDFVRVLGALFKASGAFPLAEAFEGKSVNAESFGFVTVYGDWKKLSSHDDPRSLGFLDKLFGLSGEKTSGRNARFVAYTLGDEWGDPVPVKRVRDGSSYWRYRMPLPSDPDYKDRVRYDARPQLRGLKASRDGDIWRAAGSLATVFKMAADTFIKHFNNTVQIWAASLDWFLEEWGRDTFISLPGLLLDTGRAEEAKENIRNFAKYEHNGLIPNKIWDASRWSPARPDGADYNTVDGSLWFLQAIKKYGEHVGDLAFVEEMRPVLRRIVDNYAQGTGYQRYGRFNRIYMDSDGLIASPAQATWMDADPEGMDQPVTPRHGKAVEINALWYSGLRLLARWERQSGNVEAAAKYDAMAQKAKDSFQEKFWFETEDNKQAWGGSGGALRDVVEGDPHSGAVRPNMLVAVSHGEDLLTPEQQRSVVLAATKDLLTPYGLRTLSPRDSNYHERYDTSRPPVEKDQAYHQGTVWPWLMGPYVDALVRVRRAQGWDKGRIREEVLAIMRPLVEFLVSCPEASLPEVFDGGRPDPALKDFSLDDPAGLRGIVARLARDQKRGGTRSQAWSVAEVLRVLSEHGILPGPDRLRA